MNWFLIGRSIKYYAFSKHRYGHGIHSPFLYSIIRDIIQNKSDSSLVNRIEKARKEHKSDNRIIEVEDLGAGSLKLKSNKRRISDIAKYASVRPAYGSLLLRLASKVNGNAIIELGTSLGIGSMYLALGAPDSEVFTIEACKNTATVASDMISKNKVSNIQVITGSFDDMLSPLMNKVANIGLIYIDGNHRSEALLKYMSIIIPFINDDTIVVIDDIHYSKDMEGAWLKIKSWDSVRLSIDLMQMGLLFFKQGIPKQDKVIRY